jgi:GNAT superfamily N-acetyltransferase
MILNTLSQAILDDPNSKPIHRTVGTEPFPTTGSALPEVMQPRHIILRDRITVATLIPFPHVKHIPLSLLGYLAAQMNREIVKGDTYPMNQTMETEQFGAYWFANFAAVMLLGEWGTACEDTYARLANAETTEKDWEKWCLGSFYVKPNYPGRSSHVSNGGFLVTDGARNRGVGRLMGESYLIWAPLLGYTYSVFNLVYESNVASVRIWEALGFKRIGRVPGCGQLNGHEEAVDALIYGRELGEAGTDEDAGIEERFDKIRFYLRTGRYPDGADRAEKSRLRSAATHYRLVNEPETSLPSLSSPPVTESTGGEPIEKLYLKDKEVVPEVTRQFEIARRMHEVTGHGGINKTTAAIAERFHWIRIKDTVMAIVKECGKCTDGGKHVLHTAAASHLPMNISQSQATQPQALGVPRDSSDLLAGMDIDLDSKASIGSNSFLSPHPSDLGEETGIEMAVDADDVPLDPQIVHINEFKME